MNFTTNMFEFANVLVYLVAGAVLAGGSGDVFPRLGELSESKQRGSLINIGRVRGGSIPPPSRHVRDIPITARCDKTIREHNRVALS